VQSSVAALLFDMDGTLVDTESHWIGAETDLVAEYGTSVWTHELAMQYVGSGLAAMSAALQRAGVQLTIPEIIDEVSDRVMRSLDGVVPWRPGALELLREAVDSGLPTALVTMSTTRMAGFIAQAMPFTAFDLIVSGDDVAHPKPAPDAYLLGAERLGVDIRACVAIEDSPTGLRAAVASGAVAIGVPHDLALPDGEGWTVWPTLAGRTLDDVKALAASVFAS
jgi:beta-phosphoglucomutase-like phosphatase (HAD superfamily)